MSKARVMKGTSRSRKQHSHSRREESSDRYRNALKERAYRDASDSDRRDQRGGGRSRGSDKRSREERGHKHSADESYEELSRKKRKIESQLQALDLEEAAERKRVEEKKTLERNKKKAPPVRIKEEPLSDNDVSRRPKSSSSSKKLSNVERRQPQQSSSSSSDDNQPKTTDSGRPKSNTDRRRPKQQSSSSSDDNQPKTTDGGRPKSNGERCRPQQSLSSSSDDNQPWGGGPKTTTDKPKEKPNFAVSGKLAEDTNMYNGVVIKYNEPSEARKPQRRWRLYPFKGDTEMPFIPIHRQSAYLFGRTRSIADIPIDHPSCSKQHAVLQFRLTPYTRDDGTKGRRVRPYIIDLESSNGTFVNNRRIDARCYVELMEKDVVKFGFSTREYVVLHEESRNEEDDDDITDSN